MPNDSRNARQIAESVRAQNHPTTIANAIRSRTVNELPGYAIHEDEMADIDRAKADLDSTRATKPSAGFFDSVNQNLNNATKILDDYRPSSIDAPKWLVRLGDLAKTGASIASAVGGSNSTLRGIYEVGDVLSNSERFERVQRPATQPTKPEKKAKAKKAPSPKAKEAKLEQAKTQMIHQATRSARGRVDAR